MRAPLRTRKGMPIPTITGARAESTRVRWARTGDATTVARHTTPPTTTGRRRSKAAGPRRATRLAYITWKAPAGMASASPMLLSEEYPP
jgi:hypothetical protein